MYKIKPGYAEKIKEIFPDSVSKQELAAGFYETIMGMWGKFFSDMTDKESINRNDSTIRSLDRLHEPRDPDEMLTQVREDRLKSKEESEVEKGLWLENATKQIREFSKMIYNNEE